MANILPFVSINGVELKEFNSYHPQRFDITKGGRNELTGKNRLRLVAKKWKLIIGADFISDAEFKKITDAIDANSLSLTVVFKDKDAEAITFNGYAVYDKERTPESDSMNCWANFNLELIEN